MMIKDNEFIRFILQHTKKMHIGESLSLKTFKKDRGLIIQKTDDNHYVLKEFGKNDEIFKVNENGLKKQCKQIHDREFFNSHNIHVSKRKN